MLAVPVMEVSAVTLLRSIVRFPPVVVRVTVAPVEVREDCESVSPALAVSWIGPVAVIDVAFWKSRLPVAAAVKLPSGLVGVPPVAELSISAGVPVATPCPEAVSDTKPPAKSFDPRIVSCEPASSAIADAETLPPIMASTPTVAVSAVAPPLTSLAPPKVRLRAPVNEIVPLLTFPS